MEFAGAPGTCSPNSSARGEWYHCQSIWPSTRRETLSISKEMVLFKKCVLLEYYMLVMVIYILTVNVLYRVCLIKSTMARQAECLMWRNMLLALLWTSKSSSYRIQYLCGLTTYNISDCFLNLMIAEDVSFPKGLTYVSSTLNIQSLDYPSWKGWKRTRERGRKPRPLEYGSSWSARYFDLFGFLFLWDLSKLWITVLYVRIAHAFCILYCDVSFVGYRI